MLQMAEQNARVDVVLMDPPRSGSTEDFIRAVRSVQARRVVYVSCGPDTLARDLEVFKRNGYQPEAVYPYDLFPATRHTEVICCLSRTR
jgi:23S rRNA (uracil1939-C5)-methyltransferase